MSYWRDVFETKKQPWSERTLQQGLVGLLQPSSHPPPPPSPCRPTFMRFYTCQMADPDRASTAPLPTCVSPASFYAGVGESPSSPPATHGGAAPCDDAGAAVRNGKENLAPLSLREGDEPSEEETSDLSATSKFFGGAGDNGGAGGNKGLPARQSGLRRRFRPPHAAPRSAASAAATGSFALRGGYGSGGRSGDGGGANQDGGDGEPDPWGAEYAYPRLDAPRKTATGDRAPTGAGRSGSGSTAPSSGGCGRRLKRRRTLGVGSLVPSGLIRGLEGAARSGLGGPGRRSKSLGGGVFVLRASFFWPRAGVCDSCVTSLKRKPRCVLVCWEPEHLGIFFLVLRRNPLPRWGGSPQFFISRRVRRFVCVTGQAPHASLR